MYRLSRNELFCWVVKVFFIFQLKNKILKGSLYLYSYFQNLWLYCVNQASRDLNDFYNQSNFFFGLTKALIKKAKFPYGNNRISQIISISTLYRFIRFQYIYILRSIPIIIQKVTHLFKHGTIINKHPTIQAQASIIENVYQNSKFD